MFMDLWWDRSRGTSDSSLRLSRSLRPHLHSCTEKRTGQPRLRAGICLPRRKIFHQRFWRLLERMGSSNHSHLWIRFERILDLGIGFHQQRASSMLGMLGILHLVIWSLRVGCSVLVRSLGSHHRSWRRWILLGIRIHLLLIESIVRMDKVRMKVVGIGIQIALECIPWRIRNYRMHLYTDLGIGKLTVGILDSSRSLLDLVGKRICHWRQESKFQYMLACQSSGIRWNSWSCSIPLRIRINHCSMSILTSKQVRLVLARNQAHIRLDRIQSGMRTLQLMSHIVMRSIWVGSIHL